MYCFSCILGICASHYRALHMSVSCLLWMAIVGHPDSLSFVYSGVCVCNLACMFPINGQHFSITKGWVGELPCCAWLTPSRTPSVARTNLVANIHPAHGASLLVFALFVAMVIVLYSLSVWYTCRCFEETLSTLILLLLPPSLPPSSLPPSLPPSVPYNYLLPWWTKTPLVVWCRDETCTGKVQRSVYHPCSRRGVGQGCPSHMTGMFISTLASV